MWPEHKHCLIIGCGSDIGKELNKRFRAQSGWWTSEYRHNVNFCSVQPSKWDLAIICSGTVKPKGVFWDIDQEEFDQTIKSNALTPLRQIRQIYPYRKPGASICVFAGSNPNKPRPDYIAYVLSKILLIKAMEELQASSNDCQFFALGPGYVETKIHQDTGETSEGRVSTTHDRIYELLTACIKEPQIGGRNIHVRDDFSNPLGPDTYKLRRSESR